jgi:hypothetical protein
VENRAAAAVAMTTPDLMVFMGQVLSGEGQGNRVGCGRCRLACSAHTSQSANPA